MHLEAKVTYVVSPPRCRLCLSSTQAREGVIHAKFFNLLIYRNNFLAYVLDSFSLAAPIRAHMTTQLQVSHQKKSLACRQQKCQEVPSPDVFFSCKLRLRSWLSTYIVIFFSEGSCMLLQLLNANTTRGRVKADHANAKAQPSYDMRPCCVKRSFCCAVVLKHVTARSF